MEGEGVEFGDSPAPDVPSAAGLSADGILLTHVFAQGRKLTEIDRYKPSSGHKTNYIVQNSRKGRGFDTTCSI